ncbi:MAG: hypothetical protein K8E66_12130, partial [Phycisphaerales bacterium]|nr:hypothetical protein [Phycisphaerales bacterium]
LAAPASAGVGTLGCNPADIAPPFGVLDLNDVNAFVNAFVNQQPQADLDQNGLIDLVDINLFVSHFLAGCQPAQCFPDIRTTIDNADLDPLPIQQNYDAINRTIHLFGPLPIGELFTAPVGELLPFFNERLESLNDCVPGNDVNPGEIAIVLEQLSLVGGPMPIGEMLVFDPGSDPFIGVLLGELRDLGLGIPDQPADLNEVIARHAALGQVIIDAGAVSVADMFFKNVNEVSPIEMFALHEGKSSGLVFAAVCDNDKCCDEDGGPIDGTDRCITESRFCNLPPPSRAFCSIASDKCN